MIFFFAFILLSLEGIAILHVNIDKASNAYCLVTLIQDDIAINKKIKWTTDPSQMKMTKQAFLTVFLVTNFCVKILANTNKNVW